MILPRRFALLEKHAAYQTMTNACGACALRHALLCFGVRRAERTIAKHVLTRDGIGIEGLQYAARRLGFIVAPISFDAHFNAYGYFRREAPLLLEVDIRDHWITLVHATNRHAIVCDSSYYLGARPVVHRVSWPKIFQRMAIWRPKNVEFRAAVVRPRAGGDER